MEDAERIKGELRAAGLKATAPRIAVLSLLRRSERPLSHAEVVATIGTSNWDRATLFRNLVKLQTHNLARIASSALGITRYEATHPGEAAHVHPHFTCRACGDVTCIVETSLKIPTRGKWSTALKEADLQLVGQCPDCRARSGETP